MPRTMFILVLLGLLVPGWSVLASPPEKVSDQVVRDEVPALKAAVQRLERELARAKANPAQAEDLAEARARLAEAEGRKATAASEWRKVLAWRRAKLADSERLVKTGLYCGSSLELVLLRGRVAEARYKLAEVEGDRAIVAAELPEVIAYYEASLERLQKLRQVHAISPEEANDLERGLRRELGKARSRLKATRKGRTPAPK
ncbi:MAG TPA: hypothetical protein VFA18_01045 [Gemmataceae bacterium]|nr:hypothetical protein [Gemmataceae bacterium]